MCEQFQVSGLERVASPSLLVWPGRVQSNIERMIELCGGPERLRPHVKTHTMDAVVRLLLEAGIDKFKASTIAEVEMCLAAGARDVLMAYPVVGPSQDRLVRLALAYPHVHLACLVDSADVLPGMVAHCLAAGVEWAAFVDFECGMARTGTCSVD
ncbi:MAG: alanine racemase, partial [Verrucomicrobiota bacterium]|nr:alanine racemase [Verrucomicrobiota bacterium]